jgi:hypothetical protein
MPVAEKGSHFSRFFVKLMEIMAAAVATAVSGYLVAHLGGYLPPQVSDLLPSALHPPAAVAPPPAQSTAAKTAPVSLPAPQPAPAAADAGEQRAAPQQDGGAPPAKKSAKVAPPHKSAKSEANAAESKPREAAESKPREGEDKESVEARVRAALANVDANRPAPPRPTDMPAPNVAGLQQPRPVEVPPAVPSAAAVPTPQTAPQTALQSPPGQTAPIPPAPVPAPAQAAPAQAATVQPGPAQPDPLTTVEIKSRPVATLDDAAPAAEAPPAPPEERGLLSAIKHIFPDLRRPTPVGEAPRPPAPVGD